MSVTGQHRLTLDDNELAAVIDHANAPSPGLTSSSFNNFPGKLQNCGAAKISELRHFKTF